MEENKTNYNIFTKIFLFLTFIVACSINAHPSKSVQIDFDHPQPPVNIGHLNKSMTTVEDNVPYPNTSYFDVHIHLASGYDIEIPYKDDYEKKMEEIYNYEIDQLYKKSNLRGGFLLTPTYLPKWSEFSIERIIEENNIAAKVLKEKIISNKAKQFRILCGIDVQDSRAAEIAEKCLNLENVVGLKLRITNPSDQMPLSFTRLVELTNQHNGILLVHFHGTNMVGGNQLSKNSIGVPERVKELVQIMSKYPNANLIIAHSGFDGFIGKDGLIYIGDYFKENRIKRNIFIDTSFCFKNNSINDISDIRYKEIVTAWQVFDLNFVLFGSDSYNRSLDRGGIQFLVDFLGGPDSIKLDDISLLNKSEKTNILESNFLNFIN